MGIVGTALFASNISTIHPVGLAASGSNEGLVWGNFEWMSAFTLILLSLVFAPFYFRGRMSRCLNFLREATIVAAWFEHLRGSGSLSAVLRDQCGDFIPDRLDCGFYLHRPGGRKTVVVTETFNIGSLP
jgi:hypothetical protein